MSVKRRGDGFMVDVKVGANQNPTGAPIRFRKVYPTKAEADLKEKLARASILATGAFLDGAPTDTYKPKRNTHTVGQAIDLAWRGNVDHPGWRTQRAGEKQHRNALAAADIIGRDTPCHEVTSETYRTIKASLQASGNSDATITRKVQALHRALFFAQCEGWLTTRATWVRPKENNVRLYTFTPEMEEAVVRYFRDVAFDTDMADAFRLGILTGCRASELLNLEGADVSLGEHVFRLWEGTTKNTEGRVVTLYDASEAILERRIRKHGEGRLFPTLSLSRLSNRMQEARATLDDPDNAQFTFHATRHTFASRWAMSGIDLFSLMNMLGHKSERMTLRYMHMNKPAMVAKLRAMAQGNAGLGGVYT